MNKIIILILTMSYVFMVVACSGSNEEKVQQKAFQNTGFRQTNWGMTPDEVKQTEKSTPLKQSNELVLYRVYYMDRPAKTGFVFKDGKLVKGAYLFEETYDNPDEYIATYEKIKSALISDYGPPSLDEIKWANDEDRDLAEADGKSVCEGEVIYKSEWVQEYTLITLLLDGANHKCRQGIIYESKLNYISEHPEAARPPAADQGK